jgi:hypothetical protein
MVEPPTTEQELKMARPNGSKKSKWTDQRSGITGESFGRYWRVDCKIQDEEHELHLYADRFAIESGMLVLYKGGEPYRAFAPGAWEQVAAISCLNGTEMYEDHDFIQTT